MEGITQEGQGQGGGQQSSDDSSGGAYDDVFEPLRPRRRKRSNSVPIPVIQVSEDQPKATEMEPNKRDSKDTELPLLDEDELKAAANKHHRGCSLSEVTGKRKKSIIGTGLEVSKLKHFKSFVESKILSKSDRALESDDASNALAAAVLAQEKMVAGQSNSTLSTALAAKDSFRRRSSRTSFSDFDPNAPTASLVSFSAMTNSIELLPS